MPHHLNGDDFPLQRCREHGLPDIMFSDVLPYLQRRAKDREIYAAFPDLSEKQLLKAHAFYRAKITVSDKKRPMRALCDENISKRHVISCQKHFSFATSVAIEKIAGYDDPSIWAYARDEGFDFIVTHDQRRRDMRDLTRIAVVAWHEALVRQSMDEAAGNAPIRLPIILHLTGRATESKKFNKILKRNLRHIFESRAQMVAPVLRMNEAGLHTEIGFEDIMAIVQPVPAMHERLRRQEQWARYYLRRSLPEHKWADRETPHVIDAKQRITRAVAMASRMPRTERTTRRRLRLG
ncbi:MAG: DUF5615 family PIN-like protein [Alphaproteobacteria bacterium]|nr:DUF5615 family PIN-like protein [Alphaproteobacteria bacterium]